MALLLHLFEDRLNAGVGFEHGGPHRVLIGFLAFLAVPLPASAALTAGSSIAALCAALSFWRSSGVSLEMRLHVAALVFLTLRRRWRRAGADTEGVADGGGAGRLREQPGGGQHGAGGDEGEGVADGVFHGKQFGFLWVRWSKPRRHGGLRYFRFGPQSGGNYSLSVQPEQRALPGHEQFGRRRPAARRWLRASPAGR